MLGLLAAYKDFPEETAIRLLSNDLLIDSLRATQDDEKFQAQVESAIASENQALLEERAALSRQVEALRADKEHIEKELAAEKAAAASEAAKAQEAIQANKKAIETLAADHRAAEAKAKEASAKLSEMIAANEAAEKSARHRRLVISAVKRSLLALGILIVSELVIGYLAWQYGEGQNLFQKITKAWPWLAGDFGAVAILYPFIMGRDRMRLLKWWKGEADQMEIPKK